MLPCISYTVFVVVTSSVAPIFPNMAVSIAFAKQLLIVSLTGFAVSIAVVLLIMPTTNRSIYREEVVQWTKNVEECLAARVHVMMAIIPGNMLQKSEESKMHTVATPTLEGNTADTASAVASLLAVISKTQTDLAYGRREFVFGKLNADDLSRIQDLLVELLQPILGLMASADFVKKQCSSANWTSHRNTASEEHGMALEAHGILIEAMKYALQTLEFVSRRGDSLYTRPSDEDPGAAKFATHTSNAPRAVSIVADLDRRLHRLKESKQARTQEWLG